jgi:hypothetical protein
MQRRCWPNTVTVKPPIPIEDIVEKHLKLRFEFDDTHKLFGIPRDPECDADILGAIFFDEARIVIDESLDPEENPAKEGRYRFTLAPTRAAGIGACIATCSLRTRCRPLCSADRRLPSSAGRARPRSGWSGRRTSTPLVY